MTHELQGPEQDRAALLALIDRLAAAWSGDSPGAPSWLDPEARLDSNLHGQLGGAQDIQNALAADGRQGACTVRTSNRYAAAQDDEGVASFYAYGLLQNRSDAQQALLFGATVVLRATRTEGGWKVSHVRISSSWMRGSDRLASHWLLPPSDAGWQVGDPPPVLVSELHSPWALQPIGTPPSDLFDAISELYSRYSFAIDQGDINLLIGSYTADIAGGFAPMGQYEGRHAVIGQLRSFRRHWPWMQHFAELVRVEADPDGRHANAIVGRIVPEQPMTPEGKPLYGAHYQLRARREEDGQWRFCWTDYRPGWFDTDSIPEFDIGHSTA